MGDTDLNKIAINTDGGGGQKQEDHFVHTPEISCFFKNIEKHLIEHIEQADYVFGCVAWMTSFAILDALGKKNGVSIIVQKEDFLRPDRHVIDRKAFANILAVKYKAMRGITRMDFGSGLLFNMSTGSFVETEQAVRCVGLRSPKGVSAAPRSHHKFVVFAKADPIFVEAERVYENKCRELKQKYPSDSKLSLTEACAVWEARAADLREAGVDDPRSQGRSYFQPYAVWTGSFNFTRNATHSFENAVVIRRPEVVAAYYNEYQQIAALSEPLDNWDAEWVAPEWRIGT